MKKLLLSYSLFFTPYFLFSQNVGIGTTTPVTKLHVVSSNSNVAIFSGASSMYITLAEGGSNRGYIGSFAGNPEDVDFGTFGGNSTGKVHLTIEDVPKLTVDATGNVGIGITTPEQLLSVAGGMVIDQTNLNAGTSATMLHFGSSSGEGVGSRRVAGSNQYGLDFYTNNINRMTINNGGNVGIGTISPIQLLDINGGIRIANTSITGAGSMRFNNGKFEGHNGTSWTSFDQLPTGTLVSSPVYPNTNLQNSGYVFQGLIPNITMQQTVTGVSGDTWLSTATQTIVNPSKREKHSSIWTGTEMISWGGDDGNFYLNSGVRYFPGTNSWINISSTNAPAYRENHSAIWTGTDMIIFGGTDGTNYFNTGARYNPLTDSWTSIPSNSTIGPTGHTAIWTGGLMIIWGGTIGTNTGAKYNPSNNTWTSTSTTNAPTARQNHTAIWTGTEMVIWGGTDGTSYFNTGAKYNSSTNTWTTVTTTNAPSARAYHTAIWTGTEMIIWGGTDGVGVGNTGAKYNPSTNTWTTMSTTNAPSARYNHTAVWTGTEMIVWGGNDEGSASELNSGARYNPSTNTWTTISTSNVPSPRSGHTAIWAGQMIIYGGGTYNPFDAFNTGGRYFPTAQPAYNTTIETSSSIYLYSKQ